MYKAWRPGIFNADLSTVVAARSRRYVIQMSRSASAFSLERSTQAAVKQTWKSVRLEIVLGIILPYQYASDAARQLP